MKLNFNIFKRKSLPEHFYKLHEPDGTLAYFNSIKSLSEKYWSETDINPDIYGFQVQRGTKWNDGLSENELNNFQAELDLQFPEDLKNFYRTMNGLDKCGMNVYGSDGTETNFRAVYYSYPEDISVIRDKINWIYESNNLNPEKVESENIPKIFPVVGHRFVILDGNNQILSMHGDDIIFWAENVSKLIATDIFENITNVSDFESNLKLTKPIKFWL